MNHKLKTVIIGALVLTLSMGADGSCEPKEGGGTENGKKCLKKKLADPTLTSMMTKENEKECTLRHLYLHVVVSAYRRIGVKIQHDANGHWETYERSTELHMKATDKSPAYFRYELEKDYDVPANRDVSLQASIPGLRDWPYAIRISCEIKAHKTSPMPYSTDGLSVKNFADRNGEVHCLAERDLDI